MEGQIMARTVSIGTQDFEELISRNNFYVDKTRFIREWWESDDKVTLITRPRRFGKTLNMNMLERFFSVRYEGKGEVFEGLDIWQEKKYRELQGTYPVIFLSFANVKQRKPEDAIRKIKKIIWELYDQNQAALCQIEEKKYEQTLLDSGIGRERIRKYGFAFEGKKVLIG